MIARSSSPATRAIVSLSAAAGGIAILITIVFGVA
jgi:hypothetical protein